MEGALCIPLLERMNILGNWICCMPWRCAMDWGVYLGVFSMILTKEAIHQLRKWWKIWPPKKLGVDHSFPHVFCLAPSHTFQQVHFFTASFKKKPWSNGVTFWDAPPHPSGIYRFSLGFPNSHPTNVSPHPSFRVCDKSSSPLNLVLLQYKLIFLRLFQHTNFNNTPSKATFTNRLFKPRIPFKT